MKAGDTVYIVTNNSNITEVTLKRISGNLCVVRFNNGGGIQIPKSRLFETPEQALEHIKNHSTQPVYKKEEQNIIGSSYYRNAQLL